MLQTEGSAAFASTKERYEAIQAELARLQAKDSPQEIAHDILAAFSAIVEVVGEAIDDFAKLLEVPPSGYLQAVAEPIILLHDFLELFDKTDSSRVPFELLESFEQLTTELLGEAVSFIFKPTHGYNYSVLDLRQQFKKAGLAWKNAAGIQTLVLLVTFPSAEAGSALLHTLLYHEIGHAFYAKHVAPFIEDDIEVAIDDVLRALEGAEPFEGKILPADEHARASSRVDAIEKLAGWVEEIACDLIAIRLVGPAYLCAFRFFADPFLIKKGFSRRHPDRQTRARFMDWYVALLRGEMPALDSTCTLFKDFASLSDLTTEVSILGHSQHNEPPQEPVRIAAGALREDSQLFERLAERLRDLSSPFANEGMTRCIERGSEQIAHMVPPVIQSGPEIGSLGEVLAIAFCSAWLFRTAALHRWTSPSPSGLGWDRTRALTGLSQILLTGVEAGQLELGYRRRRAETNRTRDRGVSDA